MDHSLAATSPDANLTFPPVRTGPRDPGDAWVEGSRGKFWGRFGAAGVLAYDPGKGVLLQHRALWSHNGGTWGLPGGALNQGEDAVTGALREAPEAAAMPAAAGRVPFTSVLAMCSWPHPPCNRLATAPYPPGTRDRGAPCPPHSAVSCGPRGRAAPGSTRIAT